VRSVGYRFRFVELAEEISARMPAYVAQRVQNLLNVDKKPVNGSVVLLLGVTYKANVSDQRETPARPLAACLSAMGAEVRYFDPHADTFTFNGRELVGEDDLEEALSKADLGILVQAHNEIIESGALKRARCILDTRGVLSGDNVERL
jgi:UDP-N-acetyl-D-mannosaminuronate dehydrogenase